MYPVCMRLYYIRVGVVHMCVLNGNITHSVGVYNHRCWSNKPNNLNQQTVKQSVNVNNCNNAYKKFSYSLFIRYI